MEMREKPMLAHPMADKRITDENWKEGMYIQPKLDGVRCLIQCDDGKVQAFSRTGKLWKNIDHVLIDLLPFFEQFPSMVLDGELYNHDLRDDFGKIISLVRKTKPSPEDRLESSQMIKFYCYDAIGIVNFDANTTKVVESNFIHRVTFLFNNLPRAESLVLIGPENSGKVNNYDEIPALHKFILECGYEGSILRKNKPYETKRSWNLMKVKDFHDTEARIIGWVEGKGKRIGTIGKFIAVDEDGNEFGMPVMDNFKKLQDMFVEMQGYIGRTATFTYFERTKANSYRHPLFKCIRDYE